MSMTHKPAGKLRRADDIAAYLLLAPFLLFLLAFIVYPVIQNLYYSFTNYNLGRAPSWIGLRNYTRLMGDEVFQFRCARPSRSTGPRAGRAPCAR